MKVSKKHVNQAFGKAAKTYNEAAVVQTEILTRLLSRLALLQPECNSILDLGSGTGLAKTELQKTYGESAYMALDMSFPMLKYALNDNESLYPYPSICADMEALPLRDNVLETIFSASCFQWSNSIEETFLECLRTLKNEGLLLFSTFGPGTLNELQQCFQQVDTHPHVNEFIDMHEMGDVLLSVGFSSPVMESETITVEYSDPRQLFSDLKATGATNHVQNQSKGLLTKERLNTVIKQYEQFRLPNGKYPVSYEVIFGHGRKLTTGVDKLGQSEWQPISFKPQYSEKKS